MTAFERILRSRLVMLRARLLSQATPPASGGRTQEEVQEIDAALARLADGTFGICDRCGRALGQHRLLAEPAARICHLCAPLSPLE